MDLCSGENNLLTGVVLGMAPGTRAVSECEELSSPGINYPIAAQ